MTIPMPSHNCFHVHLFALMRVHALYPWKTCHAAAMGQAIKRFWDSLHREFQSKSGEFTEEFSYYLLDPDADDDDPQSRGFFVNADPRTRLLARLVEWYDADSCSDDQLESIIVAARRIIDESTHRQPATHSNSHQPPETTTL